MKIKELLTEQNWIKGDAARDKYNVCTTFDAYDACKWCLLGAVYKCYNSDEELKVRQKIRDYIKNEFISAWNDEESRIFEDIKELVETLDI